MDQTPNDMMDLDACMHALILHVCIVHYYICSGLCMHVLCIRVNNIYNGGIGVAFAYYLPT